jgi:dihydroorotate dehydrogenase (fumarate)
MDLTTRYMGLTLPNPLVASPTPLSNPRDGLHRLADGGVGAIVLFSRFEEQLREEALRNAHLAEAGAESVGEALDYLPSIAARDVGPRSYLELLERAATVIDVPAIASLNGATLAGWTSYAHALQDAGAAAIELNIHFVPDDPQTSGRDIEQRHIEILQRVKGAVSIPVAVKLSSQFSSIGEMALRLDHAGADGLVLVNRFLMPDIDPEELAIVPRVNLSTPGDGRLPRAWIALLHGRVTASLAATTGVELPADVAAHLLAGASVVMTTSALLRYGPQYATRLLDGLQAWTARKGFETLDQVRGALAESRLGERSGRRRDGYVAALRAADAGTYAPW